MHRSILIAFVGLACALAAAAGAPPRTMPTHSRLARTQSDCVACHQEIIPTETNSALELYRERFHNGTLLCIYQGLVKESDSDDDDDEDSDEDSDDDEDKDEDDKDDDDDDDNDDDDDDDDEEEDEDEEDEDEEDEEEYDPNDKYEKRTARTFLTRGAKYDRMRPREDDPEDQEGYTVQYECLYDVPSGKLFADQARSCPPVVSAAC